MKKRLMAYSTLFFLWMWTAMAQSVVIEKVSLPISGIVTGMQTAPDGRLWVIIQTAPYQGVLAAQTEATPTAPFVTVASNINTTLFDNQYVYISGVLLMSGSFPVDGNVVTLGEPVLTRNQQFDVNGYQDREFQATVDPPGITKTCTGYTIDNGGTPVPPIISGPRSTADGKTLYYVGRDNLTSRILLRGKTGSNGTCNLITVGAPLPIPIADAWPLPDGSFLVSKINSANAANGVSLDVDSFKNGTLSPIVVPDKSVPRACCTSDVDFQNSTVLIGSLFGGANASVFKNGQLDKIYGNEDGLADNFLTAYAIRGSWAALGGFSASGYHLLLVNTDSRQELVLAQNGTPLPDGTTLPALGSGRVTLRPDGIAFVSTSTALYRFTVTGITGPQSPVISSFTADPATVVAGNSATLSWQTTGAAINAVSIDQGIGPVPASGTLTVSPTQTTTYTLLAANSAGSVMSTVTVTVTPAPRVPVITIAGDNTVITNGTQNFDTTLAANGWVAIFGSNLSASTLQADGSDGFPYILGNTTVALDDKPVQLSYVSPTQVNAHLPSATADGIHNLVVFFSGTPSKPKAVSVAAISPRLYPFASDSQTWAVVGTDADHPLHIGQNFILWGTGMGPTTCSDIGDNPAPTTKLCALLTSATATLAFGKFGAMAKPVFIGAAPGLTGVYQINGTLPPILDAGLVDVVLSLGGLYTTSTQLYVAP